MKKGKVLRLCLLAIFLLIVFLYQSLATHAKILLFISEEFPQIPFKPLGTITKSPLYQKVKFESVSGEIVADLFVPANGRPKSAIVVAMGIKTAQKDKPLILKFADTMARLGYVTIWPRLEVLDQGTSLPEQPETFIEGFKYLAEFPQTDPGRITFVGFSVGSSVALVAAADPEIANQVHGLVFFGGQFDIFDYLLSLASKTYQVDGERVKWNAAEDARSHARGLLKEATQTAKIFEVSNIEEMQTILAQVPDQEKENLKRYSPKEYVSKFQGKLFILHDKTDHYVPYVESVKLNEALGARGDQVFVLVDLFEHVQPNKPLSWQNLKELAKLYGFLYQVFSFL